MKNKQISEEQSKREQMQGQREDLEVKLKESQQRILTLQNEHKEFENKIFAKNENSPKTVIKSSVESNGNYNIAHSYFKINEKLKDAETMMNEIVSKWQYNSQVFVM